MSPLQRLAAFTAVFVLSVSGLALVDALTAPPSAAPEAVREPDTALTPGRMFVLVIDSLRYETAVSAELMPELSALRARAAFARVTPTRDAVTVPCLRAAFTGRDRTRVFGFVENFLKGNAGLESIFTALAARGGSAAVYSDGAFDQFGDRGIARLSNGDPVGEESASSDHSDHVAEQNATLPAALAEYRSGKRDLVVLHVTYTDHVAHEVGVGAPLYKERYLTADALVARLDRELPASDTFVVMGDHGHDATGRHAVGLDVPTYALYRGPRFVPGADLGTMAIRDHRYLLGFGLGLSLPVDYAGERHVAALRAGPAGLGSYAAAVSGKHELSLGVPQEAYSGYAIGAVVLALLFAGWTRLVRLSTADKPSANVSLLAALAALVFVALGMLFVSARAWVHEPSYLTLVSLWIGLWGAALAVSFRTQRIDLAALVLGLPLFFLVPTVYRYGAPAAMAPAWLGLLACAAVVLLALQRRPPLGAAALACALLLPFGLVESSGFRFDEWVLWPPAVLPSGFLLLSLLAKWIVLVPPGHTLLGVAAAALVTGAQLKVVPYALQLLAACALLAFWAFDRRQRRDASIACVTALLLFHHYAVRVPSQAYYWQDCLLAALVLSARIIRPLPSPARAHAHAALLLLAFFVSGWVSFAWTLHRLEWAFLYDFWSAAFVEKNVATFLPLLMGRFALPLIAARVLLQRELPERAGRVHALGLAWLLVGAKVASLMFWSYGTAFVSVVSDVYLEAVQETSLACVLLLGLL